MTEVKLNNELNEVAPDDYSKFLERKLLEVEQDSPAMKALVKIRELLATPDYMPHSGRLNQIEDIVLAATGGVE